MARFPAETAGSQEFLDAANEREGEIRSLGAKPEQRYFGVGPKKGSLSQADQDLKSQLSQTRLQLYGKGMQKRRLEKGTTKMVRGKEVNR